MEVPGETIIIIYRSKLKNKEFNTLKEHSDDFSDFLNREKQLFPESEQKNHLKVLAPFFGRHQKFLLDDLRRSGAFGLEA